MSFKESIKENVKEFFYFLAKGRSRPTVNVNQKELENSREQFAKDLDNLIQELVKQLSEPEGKAYDGIPEVKPYDGTIRELTESQVNKLLQATKHGGIAWGVPGPKAEDTEEKRESLEKANQEMFELFEMGLAIEVTNEFSDKVEAARTQYGRQLRYFAPSEMAFKLFKPEWYRDETGEDVQRERKIQ